MTRPWLLGGWLWLASGLAAMACSADRVILWGETPKAQFTTVVADTDETRGRGLMFVEEMPAGASMLFVYDSPRSVAFWMRNTLIPLDMIFADATGRVRRIHANASPLDETVIPGGDDIQFVLEINGGLAKRMGLQVGDALQHPAIPAELARHPCQ